MDKHFQRRVLRLRQNYEERIRSTHEKKRQSEAGPTEGPAPEEKSFAELRAEAKERGIEGYGKMNKEQLLEALKAGG